ncbi:DUF4136 domain-containing protein [Altererythrobacter aurantiacus]|uniref:DUF4136 domain-containing protein n=1 Tax=Parapontixanthobacter aurantiacus TaxID=1463599 RepID=A0A844ZL49_9SPHN|nr:DUF4136 domain-containing protein [Parapontixanthobacter aurantiacus]MXO86409.1 DUF4136 domain-containing protein [Parapontixanthobacter aurantiacus]
MNTLSNNRGRILKLASAPILLASIAACATPFKADVSRFQAQLPAPQGETFAVIADDPELAGGLEFARYADFVEAEMERLGYTQASPENASLLVRFDYGVDNGREQIRSTGFNSPFYDPWYGYGRYSRFYRSRFYGPSAYAFGFYDPFFDTGPEIRSVTVYSSGIDLKIDRASDGERLFEGKAQALSRSNRLQALVPNLVEAMFTDFPGNSGETVRISVRDDAPNKVRPID